MDTEAFRLWQLISPTLPVGAYSYSQGLEYAVETGWVRDETSAGEWIGGLLTHSIASTDLPILVRVHRALESADAAQVQLWCRRLLAMRETRELRLEDERMGAALMRLMRDLDVDLPEADMPYAAAFAAAAFAWGIAIEAACSGYAWAWCESQVAAAIKLVPLGHTAGQRLLGMLGQAIAECVDRAMEIEDAEVGMSLPGFAIASANHEIQYTRLFQS